MLAGLNFDILPQLTQWAFSRLFCNLAENEAYIDTNNLIEPFAGEYGSSGYCLYPLVRFNMDKLNKHLLRSAELM